MLIDTKTIRYSQYDFKAVRASVGRNAIHDYPAMLHSKCCRFSNKRVLPSRWYNL